LRWEAINNPNQVIRKYFQRSRHARSITLIVVAHDDVGAQNDFQEATK
jgi:hypothetical protein